MAEAPKAPAQEQDVPILSRLRPAPGARQSEKRVGRGRGSGLGKTSGRGMKGQKARRTVPARFEGGQMPLFRRLPKLGFSPRSPKEIAIVNVESLARFEAGAVVDPAALTSARLVRGRFDAIKILGQGALGKALTVRAHAFSKGAKAQIEKAGGKAELIAPAAPAPAAERS
jgi:large subunit ribosomal protein L15